MALGQGSLPQVVYGRLVSEGRGCCAKFMGKML